MPTMKNNAPNMIVSSFAVLDCGQLVQMGNQTAKTVNRTSIDNSTHRRGRD
jgi:hypothetical protein